MRTDLPSALGMDDDSLHQERFSIDDESPIHSPNAPSAASET
jgi:hypothetical protein